MTTSPKLRVAFVGWGAIARTVADMLAHAPVEIVAVANRGGPNTPEAVPAGAATISDPAALAALRPDVVAEAASREAVEPWGRAAVEAGADFLVTSVSAFADPALLDRLRTIAADLERQICIHPGALAGIDGLAAARLMGLDHVEHKIIKAPAAWQGTPAETLCKLNELDGPVSFFADSAAAAASQFPKNANSTMTTALAGIGADKTMVTLVADPDVSVNRHEVTASGAFGLLQVGIANNPLPGNPKSSAMAALSLARAIEGRTTPIVI